ncbi:YjbF family lipoprotein [Tropicimonas marinistellae]|uniref:YjbF family lipoprotein n=1 Tax=Tropicimonas marinistellae TaxID=1739787 RepID=UPI00082CD66B|nr:YjbF family lipoprotein [Tropicimonas marinistellae]
MIANSPIRRMAAHTLGFAVVALLLVSCGNAPDKAQGVRAFTAAFEGEQAKREVAQPNAQDARAAAASQQAAVARTVASIQGPVMVAVLDVNKATAVLKVFGRNRDYVTWTTADRQSLTFKRGVLTGTRGLGYDLLSSNADASINLITQRRAGEVQRVYRHIDGNNHEVPMVLTCTIGSDGADTVALGTGGKISTTRMKEICRAEGIKVSNIYWVTGSGEIPQSKQWISPQMGYLATQVLRN